MNTGIAAYIGHKPCIHYSQISDCISTQDNTALGHRVLDWVGCHKCRLYTKKEWTDCSATKLGSPQWATD